MPEARRRHPITGRSTAARVAWWTLGTAVSGAAYLARRVPLYRRNRTESDDSPPDFDRDLPGDPSTLQRAPDGVGPLFHRRYWIRVADAELDAEELIDRIAHDPNVMAPSAMAVFEMADGRPVDGLDVGDELLVRLPGPWDGPVRVIERTPSSLRLATLTGHMEAGEIEFSAGPDAYGDLQFVIESWARSGTKVFDWLYERVPLAREAQLHMWAQCCERVAQMSGGVRMTHAAASTRRIEHP